MKRLFGLALILVFCALVASHGTAQKKGKFSPEKLVGKWKYVSGMKDGEKVNPRSLKGIVTVSKDTFTVPAGPDITFVIKYKLDTGKSPVAIDLDIKKGPDTGKAKGIIAVKGNKMKFCYVPAPGERPKKFASTKKNKAFYFVLKRVAKKD